MTRLMKTVALILALMLILSVPVQARSEREQEDDLIQELINYFLHYQDRAQTDYLRILAQLNTLDPALGRTWSDILDFWIHLNRDMQVHNRTLPENLPDDDSLCIVVMGYYLKSDGTMRPELYRRLEVALQAAEQYPNSYILCTGGGRNATEAGQMAKWLIKKGIPEGRIIREAKATSTIENATYGCALLYRDYPQVKSLAVITSDYHIFRSCLYFHTQSALDALELGTDPMKVVAAASCPINPNAPADIETQAEGMSILTGVSIENLKQPRLDQLVRIQISGPAEYTAGQEPDLIVTAHYASGFSREITDDALFSLPDLSLSGVHTVTVSYEEGGIQKSASSDQHFLPAVPDSDADATQAIIPPPSIETPASSAATDSHPRFIPGVSVMVICILLVCLIIQIRTKQEKKRRRRTRPTIRLD